MKNIILLIIIAITLSGCFVKPKPNPYMDIAARDVDQLHDVSDYDLVKAMRHSGNAPHIMNEVFYRGLFTAHELTLIKDHKIEIGMSTKTLRLSIGNPSRINKSVGRGYERSQFVYDKHYIYVKDGKVTGWQTI